ncbi:sugar phosphate nucleotidyltransferase [Pontibacter korlensis]|uniref:Mannose-1-phosphate guanylyltransferase n=1 Tax=Pontibacter korlensis TaxID=400092 RepID=A0A0E3UVL4_9BACT|nr:sugar phosphate nucleotidyltransferase [Pontibacter korlensis]AKD01936.1 mannose-1-phosphate guanylyltransferase [Pontibacter korlensis]
MKVHHVVLTGGVGSRLWPLSRVSCPKQYLNLFSNFSLFELAVKRNRSLSDSLIVVGNRGNQHLSADSLKKLHIENYTNIVEATPRNTAPAIAFAAFATLPDDILLITPADHIIAEGEAYSKAVNKAIALAMEGNIVTFGVCPTRPETGYGYIETDGEEVISFREKPDQKTAQAFLEQGNFLWNSGMFCFQAKVFLEELEKYAPEVYEKSHAVWFQNRNGQLDFEASKAIPSISIDYAVMEHSSKIKAVPASFDWSDMGSFEAVYDYLKEQGHKVDEMGNMVIGSDKFTSFVGLKDSILVITDDAHLVLAKEESQQVKKVYDILESMNSPLLN